MAGVREMALAKAHANQHIRELIPPPSGQRRFELLLPFNPPGDEFDLDYCRGSASVAYTKMMQSGLPPTTDLMEMVFTEVGVVYFWFDAWKTN